METVIPGFRGLIVDLIGIVGCVDFCMSVVTLALSPVWAGVQLVVGFLLVLLSTHLERIYSE